MSSDTPANLSRRSMILGLTGAATTAVIPAQAGVFSFLKGAGDIVCWKPTNRSACCRAIAAQKPTRCYAAITGALRPKAITSKAWPLI